MKTFLNKLRLNIYILILTAQDYFENLINRLNGREVELDSDPYGEQIVQQYENTKLRRGIQKIIKAIYDENGKLKPEYKTQKADLISVATGYKKSTLEKLEESRLKQKIINNPTDESGTENTMVIHNVKNAPKYLLNQQKRELYKQLRIALEIDDLKEVVKLRKDINNINTKIKLHERNNSI